jgi:twitching motility protein PilJ
MAGEKRGEGSRAGTVILVLAILALAVGGGGFYYVQTLGEREATWLQMVKQLQRDALDTARIGEDVSRGLLPTYAELARRSELFDDSIRLLRKGDPESDLLPMPAATADEVTAVEKAWAGMSQSMKRVLQGEAAVASAATALRTVEESGARLAAVYRDALARMAGSGSGTAQLASAGEQLGRAEQLRVLSRRVIGDGRDAGKVASELLATAKAFAAAHRVLMRDANAGELLAAEIEPVDALSVAGAQIGEAATALDEMQAGAGLLPGDARNLNSAAIGLEDKLGSRKRPEQLLSQASLPALALAVFLLLAYVFINIVSVRRRIQSAEARDAKQQAAILSLLDEITTLADGDLTVNVTVTEDFTGAIGDSINYTVDTLRGLVGTINETSVEIANAAGTTQATAQSMNQASESQAAEIVEIANRVTRSSESLNKVAERAEQLARQANESVSIAHTGASTVGRTIQGMAALREQIQDTAKRIKRLGESSQEIGNITELINDIAEQTNTLALNASIQAAMAGESGRGFAVVADEVQRLAERAASATRQIETLVKTIQADTNEAIVSMERSTSNVVAGARSAEEAGFQPPRQRAGSGV